MTTEAASPAPARHLRIQIGLRCNARCSYCLQAPFRSGCEDHSDADVETFLAGLPHWQRTAPERIEIWGGEPLVYPKTVKRLIEALRSLFPASRIFVSTNGLRLDLAWVEFFLSHRIALAISHDGPGQFLRGRDPLSDPVAAGAIEELIRRRPDMTCFNYVLTPENCDVAGIDEWFFERFPGLNVQPNVDWVVQAYHERHLDRFRFDEETGPRLSAAVRRRLESPGRKSFHLEALVSMAQAQLAKISAGDDVDFFLKDSGGGLTVDLKGRVLASHNFSGPSNVLGHVGPDGVVRADRPFDAGAAVRCRSCAVFASCRGQTYRATPRLEEANCGNQRYFHSPILAVARERLGTHS